MSTPSMTDVARNLAELPGLEVLRIMTATPNAVPNIGSLIGMTTEELEFGRVTFALTTRPDFSNPLGSVHGGICATLLDSVMGCAVHTVLPPATGYSTLELKVNYIRAVPTDGRRLIASGNTIHVGRTTATAEGRVVDEDGKLVAHATTTCLIHSPRG